MRRLLESLRDVPVVTYEDYHYFIHPITDGVPYVEPTLLRDVTNEIVRRVDFDEVDRILAPEAMGIHIGTALSLQTDVPLAIARKRSYDLPNEVAVAQVTGYDENDLYLNGIDPGHRVVVVDDVISTGGTRTAMVEAVEAAGADLARMVVVFDKHERAASSLELTEAIVRVHVDEDGVTVEGAD
ncbi:MAG: hypoxanthine/guanine phosphoribosyltransferase [Halobacteriales archaeon]